MRSISEEMLAEGMWAGDLNDLMRAVVSIDEYESKIDEKAIVIGFYVHDKDAAQDLNRFVQKSAMELLDVDVSDVPDQKGFYIVFVELLRNDKLPEAICALVDEIASLTNVRTWKASVFGVDDEFEIDKDAITKALAQGEAKNKKREKDELRDRVKDATQRLATLKKKASDAMHMLRNSTASEMKESRGHLVLDFGRRVHHYEVVAVGDAALVEADLDSESISVDPARLRECRSMVIGLGDGWDILHIGGCFVLEHRDETGLLVLREV